MPDDLEPKAQQLLYQRMHCQPNQSQTDALINNLIVLFRMLIFYYDISEHHDFWVEISHDWGLVGAVGTITNASLSTTRQLVGTGLKSSPTGPTNVSGLTGVDPCC